MQSEGGDAGSTGQAQGQGGAETRKRSRATLAGRFSGRLARKEDEAQLVVECALLGPLLGDTQPATLSTIVRSIASGRVRKYLEDHLPRGPDGNTPGAQQEPTSQAQTWQSHAVAAAAGVREQQAVASQTEVNSLKARLWDAASRNVELEKQVAEYQRMLALLAPGQAGAPPASVAEAVSTAEAAAQHIQRHAQGGRFAHGSNSGFAELSAPQSWGNPVGAGLGAALGLGGGNSQIPVAMAAAAASNCPALSPSALAIAGINPALLPGSAAAFNQMGQLQQQMRFGGSDHSMGGQLQVQPSLPVGTGSPTAAPSGQMMRSASEQLPASAGGGFHWPKSGEGWQQRPTVCGGSGGGNGGSAFVRPPFSPPPTRSGGASLKSQMAGRQPGTDNAAVAALAELQAGVTPVDRQRSRSGPLLDAALPANGHHMQAATGQQQHVSQQQGAGAEAEAKRPRDRVTPPEHAAGNSAMTV